MNKEIKNLNECPECHCAIGDDWKYKDFSNKNIIICPQCKTEIELKQDGEVAKEYEEEN